MPFFRTTHNILKAPWECDYFDPNWMDSNTLILPPSPKWDYARDMQIEDVDLWEVLWESGRVGVYAAWCPYAEFFLVTNISNIETFYGIGAQKRLKKYLKEHNIPYVNNEIWVEDEEMYLYQ